MHDHDEQCLPCSRLDREDSERAEPAHNSKPRPEGSSRSAAERLQRRVEDRSSRGDFLSVVPKAKDAEDERTNPANEYGVQARGQRLGLAGRE